MIRCLVSLAFPLLVNGFSVSNITAATTPEKVSTTVAAAHSLVVYDGDTSGTYDDSNYVKGDTKIYTMAEEAETVAAHPSYVVQSASGNLLVSGDSYGNGEGRGWANLFDSKTKLKWAWHSKHTAFDAVLGAALLPDETAILGGTRSILGRWELLLVAVDTAGKEKWSTTLPLKSTGSNCKACWSTIYWVDVDPTKELLIVGGVVDHQSGSSTMAWKSGGGQPDQGGVPFIAALPFSKLKSAPKLSDIKTAHYFKGVDYTTVVSLRAEHGKGVVALLPLNPTGGAVSRLTYDASGKFEQQWLTPLTLTNQVTDIAIVGDQPAVAYVVSATVNPGAKIEAFATDGSSSWVKDFNVKDTYPADAKRGWCQECWSISTYGEDVMLSCGVAELSPGDTNCDDGVWRSLIVTFSYHEPADATYRLFHRDPDENFAVEYASYGPSGEIVCAIDADDGGSVVHIANE